MREVLSGLTIRGRCFLATAAAIGLSAFLLGEKDLLRVTLLLVMLPLIAVVTVSRAQYQITYARVLNPRRISVGAEARIELQVENLSRVPSGIMLVEDQLPPALGPSPRLVFERPGTRGKSTVTYGVQAATRGRYWIGPLVLRVSDPFRLYELTRSFPATDSLTVTPQVTHLPEIRLAAEYAESGESQARSTAVHGEYDAAPREYRDGDDLRRVHWRSTARAGELMVRREEQPWESKATVILDTRAAAHCGQGPESSFEWMASAAASICLHLRHEQYKLRVVSDAGTDIDATEPDGEDMLLDYLAEVEPGPRSDVARLAERIRHRFDNGIVIALLGLIGPDEAKMLAGLRRAGSTCIAFLLDSGTWAQPPPDRGAIKRTRESAALALLSAGWRVIGVERGANLAALWPQAVRGNQGFAFRAALAETVPPAVHP